MVEEIKKTFKDKSKKTINAYEENLKKIRTGRASANMFDEISVNYYGTPTPINQVASVSVPEARLLVIQPWEKNMIPEIEKSIQKAELGLNPSSDGNVVRVTIPALTEETRKDLVKDAKKVSEEARISIRGLRKDANDKLKKALKDHDISEDEEKKALEEIQKMTDSQMDEIKKIFDNKEKEILEF